MSPLPRRAAAELVGTFCLVLVAAGADIVNVISWGSVTLVGSAAASGLVVMAMVYAIGPVSGAHINPAVTLGFALTGGIRWRDAAAYWAAQVAGASLAALALRLLFGLVGNMGGHAPAGSAVQSLGLEILLTFILMFVIVSVVANRESVGPATGLAIGGAVALCILFGGPVSGGSMNPARSFGPALIAWSWHDHWIYWLGPALGAAAAALVHKFALTVQRPRRSRESGNPSQSPLSSSP